MPKFRWRKKNLESVKCSYFENLSFIYLLHEILVKTQTSSFWCCFTIAKEPWLSVSQIDLDPFYSPEDQSLFFVCVTIHIYTNELKQSKEMNSGKVQCHIGKQNILQLAKERSLNFNLNKNWWKWTETQPTVANNCQCKSNLMLRV